MFHKLGPDSLRTPSPKAPASSPPSVYPYYNPGSNNITGNRGSRTSSTSSSSNRGAGGLNHNSVFIAPQPIHSFGASSKWKVGGKLISSSPPNNCALYNRPPPINTKELPASFFVAQSPTYNPGCDRYTPSPCSLEVQAILSDQGSGAEARLDFIQRTNHFGTTSSNTNSNMALLGNAPLADMRTKQHVLPGSDGSYKHEKQQSSHKKTVFHHKTVASFSHGDDVAL